MTAIPRKDSRFLQAMIRCGAKGPAVARALGISSARVRQIWVRETGSGMPGGSRPRPDRQSVMLRRFWARIRIDATGCWLWTGSINPRTGYGQWLIPSSLRIGPRADYAHRVVFAVFRGSIPDGLTIDHLCRVRSCCNPDHLEAVTHQVNILRSPIALAALNARKTHCLRGHAFDELNTLRNSRGHRSCRACHAAGAARRRTDAAA